ncbi:MAG: MmcQ/YjbR family DNA-binding protein [Chloroflexota bacterium]|nr:MmcQ/YjbR family DNA-binding protein [Chloroflexota bacterium]
MQLERRVSDTYRRFREICLGLPETSEVVVEAWGHPTFRVGPNLKMFASCSSPDAERPSLGMKVDKAHQQALVQTDPRFSVAAYVGKHGWVHFDARGAVEWDLVRELVLESYCLNAPKRLAKQAAS